MTTIMSTFGNLIDSVIVGQNMPQGAIGACGLISPLWFLISVFYNIMTKGSQTLCARELTKGNTEEASRLFSLAVMSCLGILTVMGVLFIPGADLIVRALGGVPGAEVYEPAKAYLRGSALAVPALGLDYLLSTGVHLEGRRKWSVAAALTMSVTDILLDLLVVKFLHGDMFMMGLTTSISYLAAALVHLWCVLKKNTAVKLSFRSKSRKGLLDMFRDGLPLGVSKATAFVKSSYVNHLLATSVTAAGLAAYNVQVQLNHFTNAIFIGLAQTLCLLVNIYYAEEDRRGVRQTMLTALILEVSAGLALGLLALRHPGFVNWLSQVFLGSNTGAYEIAATSIYYYAYGLLGYSVTVLAANYFQCIRRTGLSNLVYIISDVVLVFAMVTIRRGRLATPAEDMQHVQTTFAALSNAQLTMLGVIPVLILITFLINRKKLLHGRDMFLLLPKDFGVDPDQETFSAPRNLEEVMHFSRRAWDFCQEHHVDPRKTFLVSLVVEEIGKNIVTYGFSGKKLNFIDMRLMIKGDSIILRIRDDCKVFDPAGWFRSVSETEKKAEGFGIRMVASMSQDIWYAPALKLNNLTILI